MGHGNLTRGGTTAREQDAWLVFEDEAGESLSLPNARTWSRHGHTLIVTGSGKGSGRASVAGLIIVAT